MFVILSPNQNINIKYAKTKNTWDNILIDVIYI